MSKKIILGADGHYYSIEGGKATVVSAAKTRAGSPVIAGTVNMRDMDSSAVTISL